VPINYRTCRCRALPDSATCRDPSTVVRKVLQYCARVTVTSLDVLREVLGDDLSPEVIVAATADQEVLKPRIREMYFTRLQDRPNATPARRPGEIRPVVEGMFPIMSSLSQTDRVLDSLTFPLLYGHSAAAPDVLDTQLDGTDDYDLAALLHVYAAVAPLIDANVLLFLDPQPLPWHSGRDFFGLLNELKPLADALGREVMGLPEGMRTFDGLVLAERPEAWVLQKWMLFLAQACSQDVDPFPRSRPDELALKTLVAQSQANATGADDPLLATLFQQTTPRLSGLTARAILDVRRDDSFEAWRGELTSALGDLKLRVDAGLEDLGRREFTERFTDRARQVDQATRRSKALERLRRPPATFALSIIATASVSALVSPEAVRDELVFAAGAASTELVAVIAALVQGWLRSPPTKALESHYAVFAEEL
jgi:hypothetical protein